MLTECVRVSAVRVERKPPADCGDRELPPEHELTVADDDLGGRPEHPRLGIGQYPGAEGIPAAQVAPGPRLLRDRGGRGVIAEPQNAA